MTQHAQIKDQQIAVLANPSAGKGEVKRDWASLQARVRQRLGEGVHFALTESQGHANKLAYECVKHGRHAIVSVGGDGTHSEVASGILAATQGTSQRGAMACIHAGTGGDFRRVLGYRREADILHAIATQAPIATDAGVTEYVDYENQPQSRFFINIASTGVAGLVDRYVGEAKQSPGLFGGPLSYLTSTLRALGQYTPAKGELWVDGESQGVHEVQNLAVCNGRYFGGGMMIAPGAELDDGMFDVVLVTPAPLLRSLALAPSLYTGTHTSSDLVTTFRGREIEFRPATDAPSHMDVDGEALGKAPAVFRILPAAIDVWRKPGV